MSEAELRLLEEQSRYSFYGMLFFLAVFMFIQYFQHQRRLFYIYYALYALGLLFAFEPHFTPIKNAYIHFIEWPLVLVYFLFIDAFLELSSHSKNYQRFFNYFHKSFWFLFVLQTILIFIKEQGWFFEPLEMLTDKFDSLFFVVTALISFYIMWQVYRLHTKLGQYVLLGMFLLTIGMVTNQLMFSVFSIYVIWLSIFIELILFALAIGHKSKLAEEQKRTAEKEKMEAALTNLREQMNPHFISNSLDSIKNLVSNKMDDESIDYLTRFSKLHRLVTNHFRHQKAPISKEIEVCKYYLEMEQLRFKSSFQYKIDIQADENLISFIEIPPLLFQPFLENAILHGLREKKEDKYLHFMIQQRPHDLYCVIDDNGIGLEQAAKNKQKQRTIGTRNSTGLANAREKIKIFETLYGVPISLNIIDKKDPVGKPTGVKVEFVIGT